MSVYAQDLCAIERLLEQKTKLLPEQNTQGKRKRHEYVLHIAETTSSLLCAEEPQKKILGRQYHNFFRRTISSKKPYFPYKLH